MPTTYSWVISQLECYPQHEGHSDVVCTIHWRRQATDGIHLADCCGAQTVIFAPGSPFTPYDQLTRQQVESWLENALGETRLGELKVSLDKQLADQAAPATAQPPLPWPA